MNRQISAKRAVLVLSLLIAPWLAASAQATPFYSGTVTGFFDSPVKAGSIIDINGNPLYSDDTATVVSSFGSNFVTWGSGDFPIPQSTLTFDGADYSNVASGEVFKLGTLTYTNGTSNLGTLLYGVTLHILVGNGVTEKLSQVSILTTANTGLSLARDSDFIAFSDFSQTFNVFEGYTATADLYGAIIGNPYIVLDNLQSTSGGGFIGNGVGNVPEPGTWAMMLLGFGGLGVMLRISRRRQGAFKAA